MCLCYPYPDSFPWVKLKSPNEPEFTVTKMPTVTDNAAEKCFQKGGADLRIYTTFKVIWGLKTETWAEGTLQVSSKMSLAEDEDRTQNC